MFSPHLIVLTLILTFGVYFLVSNYLTNRKKKAETTAEALVDEFKSVRNRASRAIKEREEDLVVVKSDLEKLHELADEVEEEEGPQDKKPADKSVSRSSPAAPDFGKDKTASKSKAKSS